MSSVSRPGAADPADEATVVVGHGSRRERSNEQVREIASSLTDALGVSAHPGFIELAEPSVDDALDAAAEGASEVTLVHLSLFAASHVKNDVPLAVRDARRRHPETGFHGGSHLGVHPSVVEILDDRLRTVEETIGVDREEDDVAAVVCARGSSDPDSNADVHKLSRLLYEGRGFTRVEPTFIGVTEPLLDDTLHRLAKDRPDAVAVVPHMLGDGVLTQRVRDTTEEFADEYPYVEAGAGDPLGTDDRLVDVLRDRWREARTDSVEMSCDTCKYKVELTGYEDDVGGAEDTLRSVKHRQAHEDRDCVDDEPHSHEGLDRHVLVCTNRTCADDGSYGTLERLREAARDTEAEVKVSESSCLGECGKGPNVAVYPDGIWYSGVDDEAADDLAEGHVEDDRIVSEHVERMI